MRCQWMWSRMSSRSAGRRRTASCSALRAVQERLRDARVAMEGIKEQCKAVVEEGEDPRASAVQAAFGLQAGIAAGLLTVLGMTPCYLRTYTYLLEQHKRMLRIARTLEEFVTSSNATVAAPIGSAGVSAGQMSCGERRTCLQGNAKGGAHSELSMATHDRVESASFESLHH